MTNPEQNADEGVVAVRLVEAFSRAKQDEAAKG